MSDFTNYPRQQFGPDALLCPNCGQQAAKRVKYTWWGGALGPALFSLAQCQACRFEFNSKTGKSTKKAVWGYHLISWGVVLVAVAIWYLFGRN